MDYLFILFFILIKNWHMFLYLVNLQDDINPYNAEIVLYKLWQGFFQFEIIINVTVSSFRFIWISMLWVYRHYKYFTAYSAGIDFRIGHLQTLLDNLPSMICVWSWGEFGSSKFSRPSHLDKRMRAGLGTESPISPHTLRAHLLHTENFQAEKRQFKN